MEDLRNYGYNGMTPNEAREFLANKENRYKCNGCPMNKVEQGGYIGYNQCSCGQYRCWITEED